MKKVFIFVLSVFVLLCMVACAQPVAAGMVKSGKQRVTSPGVSQADLGVLVKGNSEFAFDLYQILRAENSNLFYSPHSISLALAMTYTGARCTTARQMENTLQFTLSQERLHSAFNGLDIELNRRGNGAKGKDGKGFRLNTVNAIWGQKDYKFLSEFLDTLAENYGAGLRILDFIGAPEPSRLTINNWVSDQTEERIKDLIPQGAIDALTRLVLTNAIYFNAAWQYPFAKDATMEGTFHLLDGNDITVPMMQVTESLKYAESNGYHAVELPYDGQELSMVILIPQAGQFETFEKSLDARRVDAIVREMDSRQVALTMPKFEFTSQFSLKKTLAAMGMPLAFTESADFSGMTGNRDLFISEVVHKAFVSVDEEGTEAAAATAVIMATTAMPASPVDLTIDSPFIFLIRDIKTGAILFVGRVLDPGA